jgi:hypothetical protein
MYVHIAPRTTCIGQAERCADHLEAALNDQQRLLDAVRCGHLAVMAALGESLSGSAGIGAFSDKLAGEHLEFLRGGRPDMPEEFTRPFRELFQWAQEPDRMQYGAVSFTDDEKRAATELDRYRTLIDHPRPTLWSVETSLLVSILNVLPDLIEKSAAPASHRYFDGDDVRLSSAVGRMRAALAHLPQ